MFAKNLVLSPFEGDPDELVFGCEDDPLESDKQRRQVHDWDSKGECGGLDDA